MPKTAIIQLYHAYNGVGKDILAKHYPNTIPEWVKVSHESIQKYALRYNIDTYFYQTKFNKTQSNYGDKLRVYLDPSLDIYDQVLYLDCDILIKNDSINIFNIHSSPYDIMAVPEYPHKDYIVPVNWGKSQPLEDRFNHFKSRMVPAKTVPSAYRMLNTGVMLWSLEGRLKARKYFIDFDEWFLYKNPLLDSSLKNVGHSSHCLDQPFLNAMFNRFDFNVVELNYYWNRFPCKDENHPCGFAHYVQDYRFKMAGIWEKIK